jgi:uncharacterized protein YjaZ
LTSIHRWALHLKEGKTNTLRERLQREGCVMALAGCQGPSLDPEDLAYTREVIRPFLDETDRRINMECLFGDPITRSLGFTPRGLSAWAGLALALHDATSNQHEVENVLTPLEVP